MTDPALFELQPEPEFEVTDLNTGETFRVVQFELPITD